MFFARHLLPNADGSRGEGGASISCRLGGAEDAGSIPAASIGLVEPKVDRDNSHIPQVIGRAQRRVRRLGRHGFGFKYGRMTYGDGSRFPTMRA